MKYLDKLKTYFSKKTKDFTLEAVFLFGSSAHGFEKETSDIDLAVVFSENKKRKVVFETLTVLSHEFGILTGRNVDVIWINRKFSKPMLYYNAIV